MQSDPFYLWLLTDRKEATALSYCHAVRRIQRNTTSGSAGAVLGVIASMPVSLRSIAKAAWQAYREYLLSLPEAERPAVPDDIRGLSTVGINWRDTPILPVLESFYPAIPVFPLAQIASLRVSDARTLGDDVAFVYRKLAVIVPADVMMAYLEFLATNDHQGPYIFGSDVKGTMPMDLVTLRSLLDMVKVRD